MSAVSLATIRGRIKTAIETITDSGLKESPLPFQSFGRTPNSIGDKSFSIGILNTVSTEDRQKSSIGTLCETQIQIQMSYRLRPMGMLSDVDNALNLESSIITRMVNGDSETISFPNLQIIFQNVQRNLTASGEYMLSNINFKILHYLPLT